jgi:hypothetical protein
MFFYFHIWYIAKFDSFSGNDHHFGYITKFSPKKKRQEKKKSDVKYSAFVQGGLQLHYKKKILARLLCNR